MGVSVDRTSASAPSPDLVWSGPEVPGLPARDTRRVYEELFVGAKRSVWVSTYAYFDGPQTFALLMGVHHFFWFVWEGVVVGLAGR